MKWEKDILGRGFEKTYVDMGRDYAGAARCTVVRLLPEEASGKAAVLYVHGFSDYFFQEQMGRRFVAEGYPFYAVDLRRYGRSLLAGDSMFRVRDIHEYFPDLRAAIDIMSADGFDRIVLIGHSTGGLTTSLFMEQEPPPQVRGLILNSPFLTWNMPPAVIRYLIPVVKLLSRVMPHIKLRSDTTDRYARSIGQHLGGEWNYRTDWKPAVLPPVSAEWVRAIDNAQRAVARGTVDVPVLLLHSARSAGPHDPQEVCDSADAVLNVDTMAAAGRRLGADVEEVTIDGGLHDLVLSRPKVRAEVYDAIFRWLREKGL